MARFDESRPYGKLLPARGGAAYTQDGRFFRRDGTECPNPDAPEAAPAEIAVERNINVAVDGAGHLRKTDPLDSLSWAGLRARYTAVFGQPTGKLTKPDVLAALRGKAV